MEKEKILGFRSNMSKEDMRKSLMMKAYEVKFDLSGTDYIPLDNIGIGAYMELFALLSMGKAKIEWPLKRFPISLMIKE